MIDRIRKYSLRRPYSRKILVPSEAAFNACVEHKASNLITALQEKDALAGILASLRAAYACDEKTVKKLTENLVKTRHIIEVTRLFETTDIRKYTITALRDFYANGLKLTRTQAKLLTEVADALDPESHVVFGHERKILRDPEILNFSKFQSCQNPCQLRFISEVSSSLRRDRMTLPTD